MAFNIAASRYPPLASCSRTAFFVVPSYNPVTSIAAKFLKSAPHAEGTTCWNGRGSISAPTREPHLEIGAPEERSAADLAAVRTRLGLPARTGARGPDEHRVVVKGGEAIGRALLVMGAQAAYLALEDGRIRREVRREAVRLANADHANLRRSVAAAMSQVAAVEQAVARLGWDGLPADLAEVATLRLAHPDASLAELGAMLDPPRSKGGVLGRLRRIQALTAPVAGSEE